MWNSRGGFCTRNCTTSYGVDPRFCAQDSLCEFAWSPVAAAPVSLQMLCYTRCDAAFGAQHECESPLAVSQGCVWDGAKCVRSCAAITAFDQFALQAFEVNAVDYLLKPIKQERLAAALAKAKRVTALPPAVKNIDEKSRQFLSVSERGKVLLVPVKDILYLKAELKYITVRTAQREYLLEESLTHLEQEFAERFVRIHRNCLVLRSAITGFERKSSNEGDSHWEVILEGLSEHLPISRRQQAIVREFKHL